MTQVTVATSVERSSCSSGIAMFTIATSRSTIDQATIITPKIRHLRS